MEALVGIKNLKVSARLHQVPTHARVFTRHTDLYRKIISGSRARKIQIGGRLDPVPAVSPSTGKFTRVSGATDLLGCENLSPQRKIAPIQQFVNAKNQF